MPGGLVDEDGALTDGAIKAPLPYAPSLRLGSADTGVSAQNVIAQGQRGTIAYSAPAIAHSCKRVVARGTRNV